MNEITQSIWNTGVPIRVDAIRTAQLYNVWRHCILGGPYWRLYLHSAPGAGIIVRRKKIEFQPKKLYLLPPHGAIRTWCDNPETRQFYLHFEMRQFGGAPGFLYQELECTPLLQELADRARNAEDLFRETAAVALAAAAVTELPREILIEFHRDHRMDRMIDYIHDRFRSPLSIEKMATGCGMGVNNFIRRFRECTGCTPYHYLTQVRYAAAARLLEAKELSIDEICAEVGIRDRFHFSRTFKRLYGQAPAAYRKAAGKR